MKRLGRKGGRNINGERDHEESQELKAQTTSKSQRQSLRNTKGKMGRVAGENTDWGHSILLEKKKKTPMMAANKGVATASRIRLTKIAIEGKLQQERTIRKRKESRQKGQRYTECETEGEQMGGLKWSGLGVGMSEEKKGVCPEDVYKIRGGN